MKDDKGLSGAIGFVAAICSVGVSLIAGYWLPFWPCVGMALLLFVAFIFTFVAVLK